MNKHNKLLAAGAAALAIALPAQAQVSQFDVPHPYAGAALGTNDETEMLWRLFGGYRFHRNFAAELAYTDLGDLTIGGRPAKGEAWEVVGLGIFPLSEQFSIFGKLGAYRGEAKGSGITETGNDLVWGVGAQFDFTRNLGVRAEWSRYTDFGGNAFGASGDQDILAVSAIYRFR